MKASKNEILSHLFYRISVDLEHAVANGIETDTVEDTKENLKALEKTYEKFSRYFSIMAFELQRNNSARITGSDWEYFCSK